MRDMPFVRPGMTKWTLLLLSSLTVMTSAILSAPLPAIRAHFAESSHIDLWARLILTLPALFMVLMGPFAGKLVDTVGRKTPLLIGVAVFGLAGTSGFFLESLTGLLIARAVQGMAITVVFTASTALIADYYQGPERADFLGLQSAFMATTGLAYMLLGGLLTDVGWRLAFLVYASAFLLLPLAIRYLQEPNLPSQPLPASENRKGLAAAIPLGLLVLVLGITFVSQVVFFLVPVQMPFHLQTLGIESSTLSGLITGLNSLFMGLIGLIYSRLKRRLTYLHLVAAAFGLIALGYWVLGMTHVLSLVILGLLISGVGLGLNNPNLTTWIVALSPPDMRGRAVGARISFFFLGQFLSPILAQPIISAIGISGVFTAAAGLSLLIFLCSLLLGRWMPETVE